MEPNGWTRMTEMTLKGEYIICQAASDANSNSASSESSLVEDGTGSASDDFPTNKASTTSATEGISTRSTALGCLSPFGSTNNSLLPPQSKIILKPPDGTPKAVMNPRHRYYRPRHGNYSSITSPTANKERSQGQLVPQANIPRTSEDITEASTLLRLVPGVLQDLSNVEIEKWVERCKEYGAKAYNQSEPRRIPEREETESRASTRSQTNKQHASAIQHIPTAEHRQTHNGRDDLQDTDTDDDTSHYPDKGSQNSNLH